jgi:hypothetical protein
MDLNRGPLAVMVENYRTGMVWKNFTSNPKIGAMLQKLGGATAEKKTGIA